MKFVDEFRDAEARPGARGGDRRRRRAGAPLQLMEVTAAGTHSIYKYGIDDVLPDSIGSSTGRVARSA